MILRRVSETGLRLMLGGILLALLVPTLMLVFQAYQQLERDTFFQYRTAAEELTRRIDEQLAAVVRAVNAAVPETMRVIYSQLRGPAPDAGGLI